MKTGSSCCLRRVSAEAFPSSGRCTSAWAPTRSTTSRASSTVPPTSSSPRCAANTALSPRRWSRRRRSATAESDPTADVEGIDACRKICILASLAYGRQIYPEAVHCEGIGKLTSEDTEYAEDWGGVIKLIAKATRSQDGQTVSMLVAPMFVPQDSQLAGIDDVF